MGRVIPNTDSNQALLRVVHIQIYVQLFHVTLFFEFTRCITTIAPSNTTRVKIVPDPAGNSGIFSPPPPGPGGGYGRWPGWLL